METGYILGHKIHLNNFFFLIIRIMFLDHSEITLEMNKRKVTRGENA